MAGEALCREARMDHCLCDGGPRRGLNCLSLPAYPSHRAGSAQMEGLRSKVAIITGGAKVGTINRWPEPRKVRLWQFPIHLNGMTKDLWLNSTNGGLWQHSAFATFRDRPWSKTVTAGRQGAAAGWIVSSTMPA